MAYVFSLHALEQIEIRGLILTVVEDVLNFPSKIVKEENGVSVYQKLVIESNKEYLYRVFVNTDKKPPLVITVYKTSKTVKYED
jgi:hypothetical protein